MLFGILSIGLLLILELKLVYKVQIFILIFLFVLLFFHHLLFQISVWHFLLDALQPNCLFYCLSGSLLFPFSPMSPSPGRSTQSTVIYVTFFFRTFFEKGTQNQALYLQICPTQSYLTFTIKKTEVDPTSRSCSSIRRIVRHSTDSDTPCSRRLAYHQALIE